MISLSFLSYEEEASLAKASWLERVSVPSLAENGSKTHNHN